MVDASKKELGSKDIAERLKLDSKKRHIFLCADQSNPKCCTFEQGLVSWSYLKNRLAALGRSDQASINRTKANCLRICRDGPIAVVYPDGTWYRNCVPEVLDRIVDEHLIAGRKVEEFEILSNDLK